MSVNIPQIPIAYGLYNALQSIGPLPIIATRNPATSDKAVLGTVWVNKSSQAAWVLVAVVSNAAQWLSINSSSATTTASLTITGAAPNFTINSMTNAGVLVNNSSGQISSLDLDDGEIIIGATGGNPAAATLTAGAGISITNGTNSITIAASGTGLTWSSTASNAVSATVNNGYRLTGTAPIVTLPASPTLGQVVSIAQDSAAGTVITLNAGTGDVIYYNGVASTASAGFKSTSLTTGTGPIDQVGCFMEVIALSTSAWTVSASNGEFIAS